MQPGSAYTLDKWLFGFNIGLRGGRYDLKITKVFNHQKALEMIYRMQLQYVRIEIDNGTEWKIPKAFNRTVINQRLQKLPCIFKNQGLAYQIDTFKQILEEQLFEYQLEPTQNENLKIIGELL